MLRVRIWGTRGSIPVPGPTTFRYGGNTSCLEIRVEGDTPEQPAEIIILDAGSGLRALGQTLLREGPRPLRAHLMLTHTHWDHIQGFPFFTPAFIPGNSLTIVAPPGQRRSIETTLAGQMEYQYFPVDLDQMQASITFRELFEDTFHIGPVRVTTQALNHNGMCIGYRLQLGDVTVIYATDHEPYALPLFRDGTRRPVRERAIVHEGDARHIAFLRDADLVVHDSQYTLAEYPAKRGWGHSPFEYVVDVAMAAGVRRLLLSHHDPVHTDEVLEEIVGDARQRVRDAGEALQVDTAAEGMDLRFDVPRSAVHHVQPPDVSRSGATTPKRGRILVADDDPATVRLIAEMLRADGHEVIEASDGLEALRLALDERPDLAVLDATMPHLDGLHIARTLRGKLETARMPVVVLTERTEGEHVIASFAEGATDFLAKPFSPSLLRTRIAGWLLRRAGAV
ncbi:MAG: response regulator [Chloroflexi bacterium]|nr:response regulator [Chloroflexota bacterium]